MIEEMAKHVERPIVMPLSNPTSRRSARPKRRSAWSGGRALVATGSPFADVVHDGRPPRDRPGEQRRSSFPASVSDAVLSEIREIDDAVFLIAARTLAASVTDERLAQGALYPDPAELRRVSARIAAAVVRYASGKRLGRYIPDDEIDRVVADSTWHPEYVPVVSVP